MSFEAKCVYFIPGAEGPKFVEATLSLIPLTKCRGETPFTFMLKKDSKCYKSEIFTEENSNKWSRTKTQQVMFQINPFQLRQFHVIEYLYFYYNVGGPKHCNKIQIDIFATNSQQIPKYMFSNGFKERYM